MKRNTIKISLIYYAITTSILFLITIWGIYLTPGDEMFYSLLIFYIIMPLLSLVVSYKLRVLRSFLVWLYPIYLGFFAALIPYIVFYNFQDFVVYLTVIPSLIGIIIGSFIKSKDVRNY